MPWYYVTASRLYSGAVEADSEDDAVQLAVDGAVEMREDDSPSDYQAEPLVEPDGFCHYCSVPDGHDKWCPAYGGNEKCSKCGELLDDGEGWDGLCGTCADRKEVS